MTSLVECMRKLDMFGHKITVNHKGEDSYKTLAGFFFTVPIVALMLFNFANLASDFMDGSRLEEKSDFKLYDRFVSPEYNIASNGVQITIFANKVVHHSRWN